MKIAVITDSSANLGTEYIDKIKNLEIIPLMITIDSNQYRDQLEIDNGAVFNNLDKLKIKTTVPALQDFREAVRRFINEKYTDILVITISSKLSSTYNTFKKASKEFDEINVHMYDSKTLSMALGNLVEEAVQSIQSNYSISGIIRRLDDLRFNKSIALYTVETLKYLKEGGRIGKIEKTEPSRLTIKPIISVSDDGVYYEVGKAFGINRALLTMRKILHKKYGEKLVDMTIHYGTNLEKANRISRKMRNDLKIRNLNVVQLTPALTVHTGPNMIALIVKAV